MVGYSKGCDLVFQVHKDTDTATDPAITALPSLPIKTHLFDVPINMEFSRFKCCVYVFVCVLTKTLSIFPLVNASLDN